MSSNGKLSITLDDGMKHDRSVKVIYHKALSIIENFFPDGEEVSLTRVCKTYFYRTRVRSLAMLVTHSLPNSLTH